MSDRHKVYIDACPFIEMAKVHIGSSIKSDREKEVWATKMLLKASLDEKISVVTSSMTRLECTSAGGCKDERVRSLFQRLLTSGKAGVSLIQMTQTVTEKAEQLQWNDGLGLKGPDAVHIASAIHNGCKEFITLDTKILKYADKLKKHGLDVIMPSQTNVLPSEYRQSDFIASSADRLLDKAYPMQIEGRCHSREFKEGNGTREE